MADAYGWAADLPDTEILERLLARELGAGKSRNHYAVTMTATAGAIE